jgi:hypothetical protein
VNGAISIHTEVNQVLWNVTETSQYLYELIMGSNLDEMPLNDAHVSQRIASSSNTRFVRRDSISDRIDSLANQNSVS